MACFLLSSSCSVRLAAAPECVSRDLIVSSYFLRYTSRVKVATHAPFLENTSSSYQYMKNAHCMKNVQLSVYEE